MKTPIFLRLLCAIFLLSIGFTTLISCGDEEKPLDKTLFTVYIPSGSVDIRYDTWFFLTDNDGNLLGIQEAVDGLDMVFERSSKFKDKRFNVHKFVYELGVDESYADFTFTTYTGISDGEIRLPLINTGSGSEEIGEYSFTITGIPTGYFPSALGPGLTGASFSGVGGNFTGDAGLTKNNIPLTYWWRHITNRTQVPRYAFIDQASAGGTLNTTFNELTIADELTYEFGKSLDRVSFQVSPYIPGESYISWFEYFSETNVSSSKLYYPGSVYDSYTSRILLTDNNESQGYNTVGAIPATIKSMPATISSLTTEGNKVTVATTGTFDYSSIYSFTEWLTGAQEHWLIWRVYMNDATEKTFTIPSFPEVLTERYPVLLMGTTNFYSVQINDGDNFNGYEDYLQSEWNITPIPLYTESFSKSRNFSSGSRMPDDYQARTRK